MRRPSPEYLMLFGAVLLWALNVTVTKYMLGHGWQPLAYGTIRYFCAISLFWIYTLRREGSLRIAREDWHLVAIAAAMIFFNQLAFVYSLKFAEASTVSLLFGTTPVFVAIVSLLFRLEKLTRAFWAGAVLTFAGVALIAAGAGGGFSSGTKGNLIAICTALTWGCYTVAIAPLMRKYSPFRISAVVLAAGWVPLALVSIPQISSQQFHLGGLTWVGFAYAVVGPLFLTNILWFTAVSRVGAARAVIVNNVQPFFGVLFALLLLSESLHPLEIAGGVLIFLGIYLERRLRRQAALAAAAPTPE